MNVEERRMKLAKTSWLVKWAYLPELDCVPSSTDICDLFSRAVFLMPLFVVLLIILSPLILVIVSFSAIEERWGQREKHRRGPSLVAQRIADWKTKTCTIVELVE